MKAKPFLFGLGAGIVGGTIAVLLSTPQSGQQLRANLRANAESTKDKLLDVKQQAGTVKQSVHSLTNEIKNNIPLIINDLKQTITTFTEEIEPSKNNLQQEIDALQNSISEIEKNVAQFTEKKKKPQEKVSD
ncbi:gas vesicle protein [Lysinibacillus sp. KCTC 33748]|uniref:YtxH domain-containing protein n=1 Tax=unclassified Lysinibacillus TaxID=2636778 RepID=UPI0009A87FAF|nr:MULTISPECIES: YtxH domain-containing protein [unclassified Lysinibacillus]OXS68446.1 gas vesicle protein [Lysinibacillus sp. KCTC 33748]SKC11641.1 Gas vesicle protein [Lysinibacillus sp. AC-3]